MALTKPILYSKSAFDATKPEVFIFNVIGGSQVTANQLTIIDQSTNEIVYQKKQVSFTFTHTVDANSLRNGAYYSAYIRTYDAQDNISPQSGLIQFYCFTTPSFNFTNIPSSNIIVNSTYNFEIMYNQYENELLNSYSFTLYDAQRIEIATSEVKYIDIGEESLPFTISYTFSSLLNNTSYYIKGTGSTVHGMKVDTGMFGFVVKYKQPSSFSYMELTNNCEGGYVIAQSKINSIAGISNPDPPLYVKDRTMINLSSPDSYVEWKYNFNIDLNFTASLFGQSFNINQPIITLKDRQNKSLIVNFRKLDNSHYYADLCVKDRDITYYIYSNIVESQFTFATYQIWIRRIDGLYEIRLEKISEEPMSHTAVLGQGILGYMILGEA